MLDGTSDFTGTARLASAVSLTLNGLPANATIHLRGQKLVLLLEVICCLLSIHVRKIVVLHVRCVRLSYVRCFSGEEFLLIQMSRIDFSRFRSWALGLGKLLDLGALESFDTVRWLNFDIRRMGLLLNLPLLLEE